jgi:CDGSH-type Zn-finger protein
VMHPDGPYLVSGSFTLETEADGLKIPICRASLCRCGKSKTMPACDGSHLHRG